jgi:SAM-dependent methyltransferase
MEAAPALGARRSAVADVAAGRVLDLGGWGDHLTAYRLGAAVESVTMLDHIGDVRAGSGQRDPEGVTRLDAEPESLVEMGLGPFDTVVSLIRTPLVADLDRFLQTIADLLAPDGRLHFVEPVRRSGRFGRLLAAAGVVGRAVGGLHLDRDLPAEIRKHGLTVTDIVRFEVPSLSAPMRPFIQAEVRRSASSPRLSPSE